MATVSTKAAQEFKQIYKEELNEELTDQEAYKSAQNLLNFFELLIKIDSRNKNKQ